MKNNLLTCLILMFYSHLSFGQFLNIDFNKLGLQITEKKDKIKIQDKKSNEYTILERNKNFRSYQNFSNTNQLVDEVKILSNSIELISHLTVPKIKKMISYNVDGKILISNYKLKGQNWEKLDEHFADKNIFQCNAAMSIEAYNSSIRDLLNRSQNILSFQHRVYDPENVNTVLVGNNTVIKNCHENINGGGYPGGVEGLITDTQAAINGGARCLDTLSRRFQNNNFPSISSRINRLKARFRLMLGNFIDSSAAGHSEFTLKCQDQVGGEIRVEGSRVIRPENHISNRNVHAAALLCSDVDNQNHPDSPGVHINSQYFSRVSSIQRQGTLFHELMHHSGLLHSSSGTTSLGDWVYGLQGCCFGIEFENESSTNAEDILKDRRDRQIGFCARLLSSEHGQAIDEETVSNIFAAEIFSDL